LLPLRIHKEAVGLSREGILNEALLFLCRRTMKALDCFLRWRTFECKSARPIAFS
jgi:hypothetical protein